jgi:hypothetical protein
LASLTDLLANLLVLSSPPPVAAAQAGSDRFGVPQFIAAAMLLLGVGVLVLLFSRVEPEATGPRAGGGIASGTPPTSSPVTSAAASPLDTARDSLERLVAAIQGGRFDQAPNLAQALAEDRQRAMETGYSVSSLDAGVTSRLGPLVGRLPAEVVPTLRSILGDLLPPVPLQIQLVGSGAFGGVPVGSTAGPVRVIVRNAGAEAVTIEGVQLVGAAASEFSQRSDCAGASLRPDRLCTVEVSFAPRSPGEKQAALTVASPPWPWPRSLPCPGLGSASCRLTRRPGRRLCPGRRRMVRHRRGNPLHGDGRWLRAGRPGRWLVRPVHPCPDGERGRQRDHRGCNRLRRGRQLLASGPVRRHQDGQAGP